MAETFMEAGPQATSGGEGKRELEEGPWLAADTARRICCGEAWRQPMGSTLFGARIELWASRSTTLPAYQL